MAIATVTATINGSTYNLSYNSTTEKWEATITAPSVTSYHQSGGYYNVSVTATNTANTSATVDGSTLQGLRFYVRENIKPTITFVSPTNGAYSTNNRQPVVFTILDESGGSGIDLSTLVVKLDGTTQAAATISTSAISNGYSVTFTPATAMSDGSHTVLVDVSDNDGNAANQGQLTFITDTVAPTLNVTSPTDNAIVSTAAISVVGTTNDATSSPVTISILLNGVDQGAVTVSAGSFTKQITLASGSNTIVVTATDGAGKTTSVTRTVTLDTSVPRIVAATITPNPADVGATVIIAVTIE